MKYWRRKAFGLLYSRFKRWLVLPLSYAATAVGQPVGRPTPPPEPRVPPVVQAPKERDKDGSKIDDRLERRSARAVETLARRDALTSDVLAANAELDAEVQIEFIFDRQITQAQIDEFVRGKGKIDKIFTNVSYGWSGRMPLRQVEQVARRMGASLLGVVEQLPAELHMDEAARNSRVRPTLWNLGIDGNRTATANRITIAILDTGVDGTHADLAGRQEYWKDWTADNRAWAQDVGHHGSHVAGIALGSGISSGINPTSLSYVDMGTFASTAGSFFPSPVHVPFGATTASYSSTLRWNTGGGGTAQLGHVVRKVAGAGSPAWNTLSAMTTAGSSPINKTASIANPVNAEYNNRYSAFVSWGTVGTGTRQYAVENTISYAGVGDGYPVLRGIAPDSNWAGLKVFQDNGSGSSIDIGEAVDDIVAQNVARQIKVANLSLGINGSPGIDASLRSKVNNAGRNGVVMVISAGNDGTASSGAAGEVDDPGRAHYAITVASSSDVNQLTGYSSHGFAAPGDANTGDEDTKPDIVAAGGSAMYQSNILSVDSNNGDSSKSGVFTFIDSTANNYHNIQGTSMAAPHLAGIAALVIDAMQQAGETWDFAGGAALADVLRVKMVLLATATETNKGREEGASGNPALNRGGKDINEGYGQVNADAAVEAFGPILKTGAINVNGLFEAGPFGKRAWARRVSLLPGRNVQVVVTPAQGDDDLDVFLYRNTPDAFGNPVVLAQSKTAALGATETLNYMPATSDTGFVVVKAVQVGGASAPWTTMAAVPVSMSEFIVE